MDDNAWKDIVESAETLEKKWNENLWVRRVILNLVNELDKESRKCKERQLAEMQKIMHPKRHNDGRSFICWKNLAKSIEEVNVLAEHYRTCQNVAAIESLQKNVSYPKRTRMLL